MKVKILDSRWDLKSEHLEVHSVDVRQVPISPEVAVQASLGNFTTENRARDSFTELFVGIATADAAKPKFSI